MALSSSDIIKRTTYLKNYWQTRDKKMQSWYSKIQLIDQNSRTNMESFVGNDPRASFNLIGSILNQKIPHRIDAKALSLEMMKPAGELSALFEKAWDDVFNWYRQRGRNFLKDLIDYELATGWYSVFATISLDGTTCYAEVWNPSTVYPNWDNILVECAHIASINKYQAEGLSIRNGWKYSSLSDKNQLNDYWWIEYANQKPVVHNAIVLGRDLVKPDTIEARFSRIPIFISPVAGLPDAGDLTTGNTERWKGEIGQSLIATNEQVYEAFNKWWSFMLQILRDTAVPRTFERGRGVKNIVKPETWFSRGAHYKLAPDEEIGFITPPGLPTELRSTQLDMEAMMQRGGPSWSMFGNFQGAMTTYLMSQVSATTNQISKAYHKGIVDCLSDIDNFWYQLIQENRYKPYGIGLPAGLPTDIKLTADYELRIPGDLVQRATVARMLQPSFELSDERVMNELFPEIKNPAEEDAKIRASRARRNPVFAQISLIEALREEAILLRNAKDPDGATLYENAAALMEKQMNPQPEQSQPTAPGISPTVVPPQPAQPEVQGGAQ